MTKKLALIPFFAIVFLHQLTLIFRADATRIDRDFPAAGISSQDSPKRVTPQPRLIAQEDTLTPQQVQAAAQKITVRVTSASNGGSGVLIAQKGSTYLVLTNKHVIGRDTQFQIQTPDGKKHTAKLVPNTGINPKYDLALLQFTSTNKYQLAQLENGSPLSPERAIYSVGYPFDSNRPRISIGKVSQLSDVPLDDGTQIGYKIDAKSPQIRQGMSGGPIVDGRGVLLGINTIGSNPIVPSYTYFDGSKPTAKQQIEYQQANWGVPVYNFLTQLNSNLLYSYDNFPKVQRQVTPTGYMARLNRETRQQTVRIETSVGNGSGVIVAKQGNTYYVLTAKHVIFDINAGKKLYPSINVITHDLEAYQIQPTNITVAEGVDLAVVKFTTTNNYPIAKIANYSHNNRATVFVGGYPARDRLDSPLWQWQLNPGLVSDREGGKLNAQDKTSFANGYEMIYTSISYGGMSGGGVFDTDGRLIGIHGKGEGISNGSGRFSDASALSSLGMPIPAFLDTSDKLQVPKLDRIGMNLPRDLSAEDLKTVSKVLLNVTKPQQDGTDVEWLVYASYSYRTGKYTEAIEAFNTAMVKGAHKLQGNFGKALASTVVGNYSQALLSLDNAIGAVSAKDSQNYYYLWKYRAIILRASGKYGEALKAIDRAIALEPSDFNLVNERAILLQRNGQEREALHAFDLLISKLPNAAYAYNNRGILKDEKLNDFQGALNDYNRAITLNPNYELAYYNRGNLKKGKLNDTQGALSDYNRTIALNPNRVPAYYNRGNLKHEKLNDTQGALSDFNRAITLNPNDELAYYNRGVLKQQKLNDPQGALSDFNRAIILNPNQADVYYNRGNLKNEKLNDTQGALSDFSRAIILNPNLALAYNNRGILKEEKLNEIQGALSDYNRAVALNPNLALAYNNRGSLKQQKLNDTQGALSDYNRAIALNPNYANAYGNRGVLKYGKLNDRAGGIADTKKAAELARTQGNNQLLNVALKNLAVMERK